MSVFTPNKYPVRLSHEQRERLDALARSRRGVPARAARLARVLLLADKGRDDGGWTDGAIAAATGMHVNTVGRVRKRFATEGPEPALARKAPATPPAPRKIDGRVEAHVVAICCSPAPAGRARWTLRLLAAELTRRGLVTEISHEAVRRVLKKTNSGPGSSGPGASRSGTPRVSSPEWKKSSTSTARTTRPKSR